MGLKFTQDMIPLIALIIIYAIVILLYRYALLKSNKVNDKFIYLNLKVNNHNKIKELKKTYKSRVNRLSFSYGVVLLASLWIPVQTAMIIDTLFIITYVFMLHLINSDSIRVIKKEKLNKEDNTRFIKMGGLYYFNPDDKNNSIHSFYLVNIPNMASQFGKRVYIGLCILVVILLLIVVFTMI